MGVKALQSVTRGSRILFFRTTSGSFKKVSKRFSEFQDVQVGFKGRTKMIKKSLWGYRLQSGVYTRLQTFREVSGHIRGVSEGILEI